MSLLDPLASRQSDFRRSLLVATGLLLLTWLAYLPALHGTALWDDRIMLTQSKVLFDPHPLRQMWFNARASPDYFPLTSTALLLQMQAWGIADLTPYHAVNVLLHGVNAVLVWRLLLSLRLRGAPLAAALFAVNPVMTESVAWISEQKNTISGCFAIIAVLIAVRPPTWTRSLLAAVSFALAILAKTAVIGMPVAIVVLFWWQQRKPTTSQRVAITLMFATASAMAFLSLWTQSHVVGTTGPEFDRTILQSSSVFGPAVAFYIGKLLFPVHVSLLYPLWRLPDHLSWQHALGVLMLIILIVLWLGRSKWGRGPLAASLIFLVLLAPVLGAFKFYSQRYSFVADHYTYLACIPLFACVGDLISRTRAFAAPLSVSIVSVCAVLTWRDSHDYVSEKAIFQHVIYEDPESWEANILVGRDLIEQHRDADAEPYFQRAAREYPMGGEIWVGLGEIAEHQNRFDDALNDYRKAAALRPMSPIVHFDYANMLLITRRAPEAISEYRTAIELEPALAVAHDNLGVALLKVHEAEAAEDEFRTALEINPDLSSARRHLGALNGKR